MASYYELKWSRDGWRDHALIRHNGIDCATSAAGLPLCLPKLNIYKCDISVCISLARLPSISPISHIFPHRCSLSLSLSHSLESSPVTLLLNRSLPPTPVLPSRLQIYSHARSPRLFSSLSFTSPSPSLPFDVKVYFAPLLWPSMPLNHLFSLPTRPAFTGPLDLPAAPTILLADPGDQSTDASARTGGADGDDEALPSGFAEFVESVGC
jgi:hypothetical protein